MITTYPDIGTAAEAAKTLVAEKLATCANITKVRSIYRWKEKIEDISEYLVIFKTVRIKASLLRRAIEASHPYEVPEAMEIHIDSVNRKYLNWLTANVK